ncbi:hypothetical protein DFJ77DRAFT_284632 [Powellomyces hirtus]|nr:hypothetical protein DFJ77DRAFT_284632 [Powellomyces hirtus]
MENGFANLRNELQSCVMYALDAGAHILLPKAPGRRSDSELFSGSYPLAAWFDMTRFKRLMTLHCGNLTIAEDEDLANITTIVFPTPRNHLFRWTSLRGELDGFQQLQEANYSIHQPLALQVDTLFRWEFTTHPVEQLRVMFDITQPNQFLTQLASNVGASLLQVRPGRYLGIHLRIESDAVGWHGGDWRALAKNFFERALAVSAETGITTWYVSCGDKQRLREFQADGSARNISVLSKWELMNAEEAAIVEGLLFDQVAVIDGLILTKAALFLGMGRSSFSRMIARDREFTNAGGSETIQAWDHYNVCCW